MGLRLDTSIAGVIDHEGWARLGDKKKLWKLAFVLVLNAKKMEF